MFKMREAIAKQAAQDLEALVRVVRARQDNTRRKREWRAYVSAVGRTRAGRVIRPIAVALLLSVLAVPAFAQPLPFERQIVIDGHGAWDRPVADVRFGFDVRRQPTPTWVESARPYVVGNLVDLTTTEIGLHALGNHGYERHPLGQSAGARVAIVVGQAALLTVVDHEMAKAGHLKTRRWVRRGFLAAKLIVGGLNVRTTIVNK